MLSVSCRRCEKYWKWGLPSQYIADCNCILMLPQTDFQYFHIMEEFQQGTMSTGQAAEAVKAALSLLGDASN